ncbi:hypothetical protein QQ045_024863 [Rhodiola kirilowii]
MLVEYTLALSIVSHWAHFCADDPQTGYGIAILESMKLLLLVEVFHPHKWYTLEDWWQFSTECQCHEIWSSVAGAGYGNYMERSWWYKWDPSRPRYAQNTPQAQAAAQGLKSTSSDTKLAQVYHPRLPQFP